MRAELRQYFVYILTNQNRTLYIGVTNDIARRLQEHQDGKIEGFSARYGVTTLVLLETYSRVEDAIAREKQLKNWSRAKKIALIERTNPNWEELVIG